MLGIIGVFLGFTLLGKPFLLWTPLVSVLFLLLYLIFLGRLHQHPNLGIFKQGASAQ